VKAQNPINQGEMNPSPFSRFLASRRNADLRSEAGHAGGGFQ